jgi:putative ABC transport system permease protein
MSRIPASNARGAVTFCSRESRIVTVGSLRSRAIAAARGVLSLRGMWVLARKILLHDRVKFSVAAAGVSISVLLVLVQIGLYFGFMENASTLIDNSKADVWVAARGTDNFDFAGPIDERMYYRVAQVPGVERAERMILAFGQFKLPDGGTQGVQVVGLDDGPRLLAPWNVVEGDVRQMKNVDGIVVDRTEFAKLRIEAVGERREITQQRSRVVGLTEGIRSFTTSPFVFTNLDTARAYSNMPATALTYVLVKAAPGVDPGTLRDAIEARIPHVDAYTTPQISAWTREYWSSRTGVGAGFFMTAVMGVIVGLVVVGQILYNGTLEHLKEYGTLKAMGAANGAIVRVILYQALISAAVGFAVGGGLAVAARGGMASANLKVALSPELLGATALLTAVMCGVAALLSILKVLRLDPAVVFKG